MEQGIRFCTSADGTRLAYSVRGRGAPVILVTSHEWAQNLDASLPGTPDWTELLARDFTVATFDVRGCGISQRTGCTIATDRWLEDIDAVADAAGLDSFAVIASSHGVPAAVRYAASRPQRVQRLVLYGGYLRGRLRRDITENQRAELLHLLESTRICSGNPDEYGFLFRLVFYRLYYPGKPDSFYRRLDAFGEPRRTGEVQYEYSRIVFGEHIAEAAARVTCPALVVHARGDRHTPVEEGSDLAAALPRARLLVVDSDNHVLLEDDASLTQVLQEYRAFLGVTRTDAPALTPRQIDVLRLVSGGQTDKQIARAMMLSPRTVEMHVAGAMKALGCATRAEAVARASSAGLLPGELR